MQLRVNGRTLHQHSHDWCTKTFQHLCIEGGMKVCGDDDYPDKIGVRLSAEIGPAAQQSNDLTIEIGAKFPDPKTC